MSPPEIWGPAVWALFHTLIEKMDPNAYPHVIPSMFGIIVRICKYLPCPECSTDSSNFLGKLKLTDYKTKDQFKDMFYLFHNWVNAKKRKPLYNHTNMNKYSDYNLILVINNFIAKYNTKGNMKLLTESFQRSFVIKDLITWFKHYSRAFANPVIVNLPKLIEKSTNTEENVVEEEKVIKEEKVIEEEEKVIEEEEKVIEEEEKVIEEEEKVIEEEEKVVD
jgi:hypothetical protein